MNLFRTLSGFALLCLATASLSGCLNAPDYPDEPAIDFNSLSIKRVLAANGGNEIDTLTFAIDFRDGDGDLGLSDDDIKVAPWNQTTGGPNHLGYGLNYIIQPFLKDGAGKFVKFVNPPPFGRVGEYDGRYKRLDAAKANEAKDAPLKGTLRYKLPLTLDGPIFAPGQVFRFEISILDRKLHQSNTITTSEVTLGR